MVWDQLIAYLGDWQILLGLLGTGVAVGYFTRRVVEKLFNPELGELKSNLKDRDRLLQTASSELSECTQEKQKYRTRLTKYESIREALLADEDELWRLHPEIPPTGYLDRLNNSRTRIICISNHKGGVGKTTIAVNLAAYFEKRRNKRVLAIDLDYQGSLSTTLLSSVGLQHAGSLANDLLSGGTTGSQALNLAKPLQPKLPRTSVIPANYEFYQLENRLMLRWLLEEIDTDIRYHLGTVLLSKEIQNNFDVVIIDTPPRLTTAAINALCASHHLIVPTVPDGLSAIAVGRFMQQVKSLQGRLFPALKFAGVVVNLSRVNSLSADEQDALARVKRDLSSLQIEPYIFNRNINRLVALSGAAGEDIAYLQDRMFREGIMDPLGDEICERIGIE